MLVAGVHMLFVRPNMLKHCSSPPMLLLMLKKADYAISNASRMGQALMHTECCCRCCCCCCCSGCCYVYCLLLLRQHQCRCLLPLFVIVCRMAKFVAGSLNLIPVFSFSSLITRFVFDVPLASTVCVAFAVSICLHPR